MLDKTREPRLNIIDTPYLKIKLTSKQIKLLDVLSDMKHKDLSIVQKCKIAGVSERTYYDCMRRPEFVKAIQLRGFSVVIGASPLIAQRLVKDAISGKYMQQKTGLEMSGLLSPEHPIINILINSNQAPSEQVDGLLVDKIIDILPQDVVVESKSNYKEKEQEGKDIDKIEWYALCYYNRYSVNF